jgi:hypothetical protein
MKKTLIITAIFLLASIIKTPAQTINNKACETAYVVFYAHDATYTTCGIWVSNSWNIAASTSISINTEAWLNGGGLGCSYSGGAAAPGWGSGPGVLFPRYNYMLVPSLMPWGWDGASVTTSGGTIYVGNSGGCLGFPTTATTTNVDGCTPLPGTPMTATWSVSSMTGLNINHYGLIIANSKLKRNEKRIVREVAPALREGNFLYICIRCCSYKNNKLALIGSFFTISRFAYEKQC